MTYKEIIFIPIILIFIYIILLKWDEIRDRLNPIFFSEEASKKEIRICPECGSSNWRFPNPLKPANNMINLYNLVNNLYECYDCGHIGVFFLIDEETKKGLKIKKTITEENKSKSDFGVFVNFLMIIISILLFIISPSLLWWVILLTAISSFLKKRFGKDRKKKLKR